MKGGIPLNKRSRNHGWNKLCRPRGREIIGLIGSHHGVGVTFTGLMLAFYMGEELGKRTAYLECNSHHDMDLIRCAYDWNNEDEKSFTFHRVTCYSEVTSNQIANIMNEDYECMILDFGTAYKNNREELLRCNTKFVVGGRTSWDIQKLLDFVGEVENLSDITTWKYLVPMANEKHVRKLKKELQTEVQAVPFIEEPVVPSKTINRFWERVFRGDR